MKEQRKQFRFCLAFVVFILLAGGGLFAQKKPKDKFTFGPLNPIRMPKVEKATLPNGLKLFLVEDPEYPTIDLRAMVRVGSVFEPAEKAGLATITGEVLRTGGTVALKGDEIDKELETLAASVETDIGESWGSLSVSVLKEDIDRALTILADLLMNPIFPEDKINLAKLQARSGISRRNDDIGMIAFREFTRLIYGKNGPYARLTEYATVDAITREDIIGFHKKYFHPNNTLLAIWGDFKSADMLTKLKGTLGRWPKGKASTEPWPHVAYEDKYTVNFIDKADVNQSNILLGHIGGTMDNPDFPALNVMNSILSFDRMFKKIRTDEGLAYSVWGDYGAGFRAPGVFSCGAQTKSQSTVYAIGLMLNELKRITEAEVTDEELAKAKDQYLNSYVFNFDSRAQIVNRLMNYAYFGYPLDFMEGLKAGVEKVTKADVLRVAKQYIRPDKVQILVVGRKEDFDKPLSTLGTVNVIDITIPPAKPK
jgi:predicted Zn-dependent peptidase